MLCQYLQEQTGPQQLGLPKSSPSQSPLRLPDPISTIDASSLLSPSLAGNKTLRTSCPQLRLHHPLAKLLPGTTLMKACQKAETCSEKQPSSIAQVMCPTMLPAK